MAKGKGKKVASSGPKKMHKGPKRKLFHEWSSTIRMHLAKAGLLSKYNNYESWSIAVQARGRRDTSRNDFNEFVKLSREEKENYFKNIKKGK